MHTRWKTLVARCLSLIGVLAAQAASAQIVLYEDDNFQGRSYTSGGGVADLAQEGFNDKASSVMVRYGRWQLCSDAGYRGQCITLSPGAYPSLRDKGFNDKVSSVRAEGWNDDYHGGPSGSGVTLYQHDNFGGRSVAVEGQRNTLLSDGFNDQTSSLVIRRGQWQICSDAEYRGQCVTLGPGNYPSLSSMGLNDKLSSLRPTGGQWGGWGGSGGSGESGWVGGVTLYENDNYGGRSFTARQDMGSLTVAGFNDKASSLVVTGGPWQLCSDGDYRGNCVTLDNGRYPSLSAMGLNDKVSSLRRVRR